MGMLDNMKVRKALTKHQRGDIEGARAEYARLYQADVRKPAYLLPYSVLLLREGGEDNFKQVKNMLAKIQKAPELRAEERSQLLMNYAIADWKLGNAQKAVALLESSHRERPCGITYQTLGFLYVEQGDLDKAMSYNREALEYDEEDSVSLDNMGQALYRLEGNKEAALPYFVKAHALRPQQIDTLWFLSRFDVEGADTQAAIEKLETALEGRFSPLNYVSREDVEAEINRLKHA